MTRPKVKIAAYEHDLDKLRAEGWYPVAVDYECKDSNFDAETGMVTFTVTFNKPVDFITFPMVAVK
jgi:hypothetical protein